MNTKIRAVIEKEWAEMRKNKMILVTMALVPILLVGMVLGTIFFMQRMPESEVIGDDAPPIPPQLQNLDPKTAFIVMMNDQYMFYFMLIPMTLPVYIAAYSIIGEKETKSLEPLLATPIATWELLTAKSIAAVTPAVVLTWLSFVVLIVGAWFIATDVVFLALIRPVWLLSMAVLSPLFACLSVLSGVIASSRMNDPRAAQQLTGIFIVPVIAVSLAVLAG
ncbi:MAG: ABC transporter permease subunit, partial [Anaerolineae bacterium]|nr:ABC transporter permease subunit [Anaerolineae bacterium]